MYCNMWHVEGRRFGGGPARARCPALALGSRCSVVCPAAGRVMGRVFFCFSVLGAYALALEFSTPDPELR